MKITLAREVNWSSYSGTALVHISGGPGDVVDVPGAIASWLITSGAAEPVKTKPENARRKRA